MIIVQRQYQVSAYSGSRRSPKTSARPLGPVSTHLSSGPIPDSGHRCFLTFFCNRAQIGTSRILERDRQVKVSGYRIELGDVEENLRALPTVSDAVVLPVMQKGVAQSLAAFVVVARRGMESEFETGMRLRAQLAERLPAYMLPRRIFFYDAFPMTANGKIDRRKLAESVE